VTPGAAAHLRQERAMYGLAIGEIERALRQIGED
jgi:hypothetical protein